MIWSPQQDEALRRVSDWHRAGDRSRPCFVLSGYAGTGKSTLVRAFCEDVPGLVYVATYTGKAASVLRKMGTKNASTIHRLIYEPHDKSDEALRGLLAARNRVAASSTAAEHKASQLAHLDKLVRVERENLRRPDFSLNTGSPLWDASLLVVDEYSMVSRELGHDLLSFGCPILAIGDPGQLPPVEGKCFFDKSDYVLTEVRRQALDNPIIRLSKDVREGKRLVPGTYGSSRVVVESKMRDDDLVAAFKGCDQLLVGTNASRRKYNKHYRQVYGRAGVTPVVGDKLVCLRNNHEEGLLNGTTWTVERVGASGRYLTFNLEGDAGERVSCRSHREHFAGRGDEIPQWERKEANEFDYGYALTVHKAQGSQWEKVLLVDEWHGEDRAKWLYTAVTRASVSVTVLQ